MKKKHHYISLLLGSAILVSCATQEPAPIEYGSSLGGISSKDRGSGPSEMSSRKFDFDDSFSSNDNSSDEKISRRAEKSSDEHVLKDNRQKKQEPKYIREDEDEEERNPSPKPKEKIEDKKEENIDSELDSIKEEKKKEAQAKKPVKIEEKKEEVKKQEISEEDNNTEEANQGEHDRIIIDEQPDLEAKGLKETSFLMPVEGKIIAKFGDLVNGAKNSGVNFAGDSGDPVKAVASGTVIHVAQDGKYGNIIIIKHNNSDIQTAYAHLSTVNVKKGQLITAGEDIGTLGQTGDAERPMLHFAVREGKVAVDPMKYLK